MELLLVLLIFLWSLTQINYNTLKIYKKSKKQYKEKDIIKIIKILNGKKIIKQARILKRMKTITIDTYLVETLIDREQYIITEKDIV